MYPVDSADLKLNSFITTINQFRVAEDLCWQLLNTARSKVAGSGNILPKAGCKAHTLSGKPRCVFFHGVGESGPKQLHKDTPRGSVARSAHPGFLITGSAHQRSAADYASMQAYWGETATKISGVCEPYFFWTETATTPWDKAFLQDEYCGVIAVLAPAIIYTHSMGNLVISAGLINQKPGCLNIERWGGPGKTRWFGIQGPLQGATPTGLGVYCKYKIVRKLSGTRCAKDGEAGIPPSYGSMVLGYKSTEPHNNAQIKCPPAENTKHCTPLAHMATLKMSGSLCGLSPKASQQLSKFKLKKKVNSWLLTALAKMTVRVTHGDDADWIPSKMNFPKSGNDGMVGFSSCQLYQADGKRAEYVPDPTLPYYAFRGNHADGTCRFDDYEKDPAQQSCAWIVNSAKLTISGMAEAAAAAKQEPEESVYVRQHRMNREREERQKQLTEQAHAPAQQQAAVPAALPALPASQQSQAASPAAVAPAAQQKRSAPHPAVPGALAPVCVSHLIVSAHSHFY